MSSFVSASESIRNDQDGIERHVWGEITYTSAGAIMKVKGTGTEDVEAPVLNFGVGFNFPKDYNTEVMTFSMGGDTNNKYSLPTIPRDKQRAWKENSGGVQHPSDPKRALEFNDKRTHLTDGNYAVGDGGTFEIKDGTVYFRCKVVFSEDITVNGKVISPNTSITAGNQTIPGFEV